MSLNGKRIHLIRNAKTKIIKSAMALPGFLRRKKYKAAPSPIIRGMKSLSSPKPAMFPSKNIIQADNRQKIVSNR